MPRKASEGPRKTAIKIEVVVANMMTHPEIRNRIQKDLADPRSDLSKYLAANFGYRPEVRAGWCTASSSSRTAFYASMEELLGTKKKQEVPCAPSSE